MAFPNTGTEVGQGRTNSGLSTQIIIKIDGQAVGAIQKLSLDQDRGLAEISEVGTDGLIEIVPNKSTTYSIQVDRVVFDQMRLPEAFSRAFRFIAAQRVPFDIEVIDTTPGYEIVMTYKNCWFTRYSTPYNADNYVITESATIKCETAFISNNVEPKNARGVGPRAENYSDGVTTLEKSINQGGRRGALDATGLFNDLYKGSGS